MASISTYAIDQTITVGDKVIGTDSAGTTTKNFELGDIISFFNESGLIESAKSFNTTIGNGTLTSIPVTHGIGNKFIQASVYDTSLGDRVECEIELTSATVTTFKFNVAPTTNQYTVVITG